MFGAKLLSASPALRVASLIAGGKVLIFSAQLSKYPVGAETRGICKREFLSLWTRGKVFLTFPFRLINPPVLGFLVATRPRTSGDYWGGFCCRLGLVSRPHEAPKFLLPSEAARSDERGERA